MRSLAVLLALGLLVAGCGRYGAPIRQKSLTPVSALPDRAAEAEEREETEQKST